MSLAQSRIVVRTLLAAFTCGLMLLLAGFVWGSFAQSAVLTASPAQPRQNDTVTLIGSGFSPGETVSVWITYPDFSVFGVAEVLTNGDGSFNFPYLPDFLGATFTPTGRYTYTARGQNSGREVYATIDVAIDQAPPPSPNVSLSVTPGRDSQGAYFVFRGRGYGGGEEVAIWLRNPNNTVTDLGRVVAGPLGEMEYVLYLGGAPVGRYALTARGISTSANGIAEFDLRVDDLTQETGKATLTVSPTPDNQRSFAVFTAAGFRPKEIVTIWVTLPDFSTLWIGDVAADADGAFTASLYLSEKEPVGVRTYTAYGNTSGFQGTASYTLTPGGGPGTSAVAPNPNAVCQGDGCVNLTMAASPPEEAEEELVEEVPPTSTPVTNNAS